MGDTRMPRSKSRVGFERSAVSDLWKHTLSQIPTTIGRLCYFASLRDPNSGNYHHQGLTGMFGREVGLAAIRESHERVFMEWLGFSLEEKFHDLSAYLAELDDPKATVAHWLATKIFNSYVPAAALEVERDLYSGDLEAVLEIIRNATPGSGPVASRGA